MSRYIDAERIKLLMKQDRLLQGNCEYELWKQEVDRQVNALPHIDLDDYVPREFHDKTCEAMAKRHQEEIADILERADADRPQGEWVPCSERLPKTDNTNEINEFDVLLAVRPKKHPERTPQVYIGKLRPVEGDDGSGNFWGVKTAPCEWTIWGWSYFQEPEVLAWMPLPKPWKGADDE